jgi:Trk K+ transport system NAD-binding subunit
MRVVIAGAGSVGRSIARELLHNGHQVLLMDRERKEIASRIPEANWLLADACEITALHEAGLAECDVVALVLEAEREGGAHAAAAHDDEVHDADATPRCPASAGRRAVVVAAA